MVSAIANTYDKAGNRLTVTYPGGRVLTSTYDKRNLLKTLTDGNSTSSYVYDQQGNRTSLTLPNGVVTATAFDADNRVTSIAETSNGNELYSSAYRYDKTAARTRIVESRGGVVVRTSIYTYDQTDKLLSESDGTTSIVYTYDDADNRIGKTVNGVPTVYAVDKLNRVLSSTTNGTVDASYTYDLNGSRASKTTSAGTQNYVYDRENRLIAVNDSSNNPIFTATYDYRTRRMDVVDGGVETKYVYDVGDSIRELNADGSLKAQFIRGISMGGGIGGILYKEDVAQAREFFLYNVIGSTVVTANSDASVKSTNLYEAFGKVTASTGSSDNNRLFCTKEKSASIGLDNFGFRYFDWDVGRFIQRDPSGYPDGLNNYLYCSNNPVNRIDPLGLMSQSQANKKFEKTKEYEDANKAVKEAEKTGDQKKVDEEKGNLEKARTGYYGKLGADGYNIYSDDYSRTIQSSTREGGPRQSAFVVSGANDRDEDANAMKKPADKEIARLEQKGYDVNSLQANNSDQPDGKAGTGRPLAQIVKNAFENIDNLSLVKFYSHMGHDINLTHYEELRSGSLENTPAAYKGKRMSVDDLRVGHPSKEGVHVDLYGCGGDSTLAQKISDAANATVRTPSPGLSVVYPLGIPTSKVKGRQLSAPQNDWRLYAPGNEGNSVKAYSPGERP